jgi:hypothetical protein
MARAHCVHETFQRQMTALFEGADDDWQCRRERQWQYISLEALPHAPGKDTSWATDWTITHFLWLEISFWCCRSLRHVFLFRWRFCVAQCSSADSLITVLCLCWYIAYAFHDDIAFHWCLNFYPHLPDIDGISGNSNTTCMTACFRSIAYVLDCVFRHF